MADRVRERLARALFAHYQDERVVPFVKASIPTPTLVVAIEVHEVFGPDARTGRRRANRPSARRQVITR